MLVRLLPIIRSHHPDLIFAKSEHYIEDKNYSARRSISSSASVRLIIRLTGAVILAII
jgi:hypothetical protein